MTESTKNSKYDQDIPFVYLQEKQGLNSKIYMMLFNMRSENAFKNQNKIFEFENLSYSRGVDKVRCQTIDVSRFYCLLLSETSNKVTVADFFLEKDEFYSKPILVRKSLIKIPGKSNVLEYVLTKELAIIQIS